ncbi:MAG: hypothetical protein M1818_007437 [Claussenomyces sp. TS43310]|nr:MAG: hypothetical protein M1818_007437 [Claussenomyces sp. TS43310]
MSGQARTSNSGVRNLRAMFENKEEPSSTLSPDRGRSPAGSIVAKSEQLSETAPLTSAVPGRASNGTSPRPLSKVRTSFVAVERSGQMGLVKNPSDDGTAPGRRSAFSMDDESNPRELAETKSSIAEEFEARKNSTVIAEAIPETALETPRPGLVGGTSFMSARPTAEEVTLPASKPGDNPDKITSNEEPETKLLLGDTTSSTAVSEGHTLSNGANTHESSNGHTDGKVKTSVTVKGAGKPSPKKASAKPTPISTTKSSSPTKPQSKPTKSPLIPKTPTTPDKHHSSPKKSTRTLPPKHSALPQSKPAETATHKTAKPPQPSSAASKTARSSTSAGTGPIKNAPHTSPPATFTKPRPRSPTKPAKLPASLTAPTASSSSKVASGTQGSTRHSLAPSSGPSHEHKPVRAQSRASLAPKQDLRRTKSTVGKSTTTHDRPALGRPSGVGLQKQPSRQSLSKQADDSFLARMMRPTAASASKTHEKIVTPPKPKSTSRPVTRDGAGHHRPGDGLNGSPTSKNLPAAHKTKTNGKLNSAEHKSTMSAVHPGPDALDHEHSAPRKHEETTVARSEDLESTDTRELDQDKLEEPEVDGIEKPSITRNGELVNVQVGQVDTANREFEALQAAPVALSKDDETQRDPIEVDDVEYKFSKGIPVPSTKDEEPITARNQPARPVQALHRSSDNVANTMEAANDIAPEGEPSIALQTEKLDTTHASQSSLPSVEEVDNKPAPASKGDEDSEDSDSIDS